jgi:hypothetical protein
VLIDGVVGGTKCKANESVGEFLTQQWFATMAHLLQKADAPCIQKASPKNLSTIIRAAP